MKKLMLVLFFFLFSSVSLAQNRFLIYMDVNQNNHLKAYGLAYGILHQGEKIEWLLNYRGGSFLTNDSQPLRQEASIRGVSYEIIPESSIPNLYQEIENNNMERVLLEKAPLVAIYTPPGKLPWDDAVTLTLTYAQIPYDKVWDEEVLAGKLVKYDWLHLHHEDFTGQYGKFYSSFYNATWYKQQVFNYTAAAREAGFSTVPQHKNAVARAIKSFVSRGGFLFAMCAACDSIDISLAATGIDIVPSQIDGTPIGPNAQKKLDFSQTFFFTNFKVDTNPLHYEFSNIDVSNYSIPENSGLEDFTLFEFSAKFDPVPTMLTQNHTAKIKGFFGQTTSFNMAVIKDSAIIMGRVVSGSRAKYIHTNYEDGTVTFYGGHDPEDYSHKVGDPPTNLDLHKNSQGYRIILNNILFPAAKKFKRKT
ncbi:MAG: asparagine synthetase B [bacterium]